MSRSIKAWSELEDSDPGQARYLEATVSKWAAKLDRADPGWFLRHRDFGGSPWPALAELWRREVLRRLGGGEIEASPS